MKFKLSLQQLISDFIFRSFPCFIFSPSCYSFSDNVTTYKWRISFCTLRTKLILGDIFDIIQVSKLQASLSVTIGQQAHKNLKKVFLSILKLMLIISCVNEIQFLHSEEFVQWFVISCALSSPHPFCLCIAWEQSSCVLGEVFQSYESHVPYQLQFLLDHNLHGMNLLHAANPCFRKGRLQTPGLRLFGY